MELVYLWVEDYKNIKKQGFNFSPQFNCKFHDEYDENGKLKDNCKLEIKENDDYIENFFGKNINVTAIVGKNGSGKSSLLEILNQFSIVKNKILIYKKYNSYFCKYFEKKPIINFSNKIIYEQDNNFLYYNFSPRIFTVASNQKIGKGNLKIYLFGHDMPSSRSDFDKDNIYDMTESRFFVPKYINCILKNIDILNKLKPLYNFNTLRLVLKNINSNYLQKIIDSELSTYKNIYEYKVANKRVCVGSKDSETLTKIKNEMWYSDELEIREYNKERIKLVEKIKSIEELHNKQKNFTLKRNYEFSLSILIAFFEYYFKATYKCNCSKKLFNLLDELEKKLKESGKKSNMLFEYIFILMKDIQKLPIEENTFIEDKENILSQIINSIKYFENFKICYIDNENSYIDIPINKELESNLLKIRLFQKLFYDNEPDVKQYELIRVFESDLFNSITESTFNSISDGEKQFLIFAIDIIYHLDEYIKYNDRDGLALFLFDEPDNTLHPLWKKQLVAHLIDVSKIKINNLDKKVHFIYSTHSPFLLSDIPKDNIIFLDKEKNGNCKVLTHDEVLEKKQTFGANIHTLLSDSFFMKDGLMGEFAKGKINEIKEFYEKVVKEKKIDENIDFYNKHQEKFWQIQKIIGEPFLQKVIKNYLDELELLFSDENTLIEKELADIEKRKVYLESLKNAKN